MKTLAVLIALLSISVCGYGAGSFPIKNGVLQNDLNVGGQKLTNVVDVTDSNGNSLLGGGGGGGSATNAYRSAGGNLLVQVSTNLSTFTYTFFGVAQTNANMQQWGTVDPASYSNSVLTSVANSLQSSNTQFQLQFALSNTVYLAQFAARPLYGSTISNISGGNYITATPFTRPNGQRDFQVDMTDNQFKSAFAANVTLGGAAYDSVDGVTITDAGGILTAIGSGGGQTASQVSLQIKGTNDNITVPTINAASNSIVTANADMTGCLHELQSSSVWSNFVDGIAFQPRFGMTNSFKGGVISGGISNRTADGWGLQITNGVSLTLPTQVSNVTIVVSYRGSAQGFTLFSLGNTNTKSSIEVVDTGGNAYAWENYRGGFYNGRSFIGFTNDVSPLQMGGWYFTLQTYAEKEPQVLAFVRDANANWTVYRDTIQGKFGVLAPLFTFACPTNATDPFTTLWLGTSGVTNTTALGIGTNGTIASVFVFNTTNVAAVVAGYRAALWLEDTDTMDVWWGDSLLSEYGDQINIPFFYSHKHSKHVFRNYAQYGTVLGPGGQVDVWKTNGGFAVLTNAPIAKIKHLNLFEGAGILDFYSSGNTPAQVFTSLTNLTLPLASAGVQVTFIDTPQVATNSTMPYNAATETNIFLFDQMVRTNNGIGIAQVIPRREYCTQEILQTNGLFSIDGLHPFTRTNFGYNAAMADLIDGRPFNISSNSFSIADGYIPLGHIANLNATQISGLLSTTNLQGSSYAVFDGSTNLTSGFNGNLWTNTVAWTHEGTTTNITANFNGTLQTFTCTNGPSGGTNYFIHFAGANGSVSYRFTGTAAYNTLSFDYQPKWLSGSNSVVTNGVLTLTSYGGTNVAQLEAAMRENQ